MQEHTHENEAATRTRETHGAGTREGNPRGPPILVTDTNPSRAYHTLPDRYERTAHVKGAQSHRLPAPPYNRNDAKPAKRTAPVARHR